MTPPVLISAATCLGCGCTCDDIELVIDHSAIVEARRACALGSRWFGDGAVPSRALADGVDTTPREALTIAAAILSTARRPRVVLGGDLSCETYREAIACADWLRARIDVDDVSIATTLAVQERGIATATLGEVRNRADVVVFWGVDPSIGYPRFESRYAPQPAGVHVPDGRRARTVIAVDIDDSYGPTDADIRVALSRSTELDTLTIVATLIAGSTAPSQPDDWPMAAVIASHLRSGAYVAVVADGEPSDPQAARRMRGLLDLAHALNVNGRGALCLLRGSGNRTGAESVMTRHTGYPNAVDFASGVPRYLPHVDTAAEPFDALLVVGRMTDTTGCDAALQPSTVVIGPHATTGPLGNARVVIDTAVAGIHSGGTAVRMDDVPIGLTRVVTGPPDATDICRDLLDQLRSRSR